MKPDRDQIEVTVNGAPRSVPCDTTISHLLMELGLEPRSLAVEKNRDLIPGTRHAECRLQAGDQLEIVTLAGGG